MTTLRTEIYWAVGISSAALLLSALPFVPPTIGGLLVSGAFVGFPAVLVLRGKLYADDVGLQLLKPGRDLAIFAGVTVVTLAPYFFVYVPWLAYVQLWREGVRHIPDLVAAIPGRSSEIFSHFSLRVPPDIVGIVATQVFGVALPEEFFYRGYLQKRLDQLTPPKISIAGARIGWGLAISAAVFAVGHVLTVPNPLRLGVFFPALLFGLLRARTDSIAAGTLYHAACNLFTTVMDYSVLHHH